MAQIACVGPAIPSVAKERQQDRMAFPLNTATVHTLLKEANFIPPAELCLPGFLSWS